MILESESRCIVDPLARADGNVLSEDCIVHLDRSAIDRSRSGDESLVKVKSARSVTVVPPVTHSTKVCRNLPFVCVSIFTSLRAFNFSEITNFLYSYQRFLV